MNSQPTLTEVRRAGLLPGESEALAEFLNSQWDEAAAPVYADWLERRDDPRGPFLRQFFSAARRRERSQLPSSEAFPPTWRDLTGISLIEGLFEIDQIDRLSKVLETARPTLAIATKAPVTDTLPVGTSKFGGCPDLPAGAVWPTRNSTPLTFLGQINFGELEGTQVYGELPSRGLLSFFALIHADDEVEAMEGFVDDEDGSWEVRFSPETRELRALPPPLAGGGIAIAPECALIVRETLDFRYSALDGERLRSFWDRNRTEWPRRLPRWLTYPTLLPLYSIDHPHHHFFGYGRSPLLDIPHDRRHLMTFDSDLHVGWKWDDRGHLSYGIRDSDLRKSRFEETSFIAD